MKLMIINGSVREGRMSEKVQNWVLEILKQDPDLELDVVDLKEVDLPFYDESVPPVNAKGRYKNARGVAWAGRVAKAEAFIMITPEYNYGPSAVLKNAIDWVYEGWNNKPVSFIGYGAIAAGTRAVQQLRQNIINVKLFATPASIQIPFIWEAFDDNGRPVHRNLDDNLRALTEELKDLQRRLAS